mgnify:CR=1 FL=1
MKERVIQPIAKNPSSFMWLHSWLGGMAINRLELEGWQQLVSGPTIEGDKCLFFHGNAGSRSWEKPSKIGTDAQNLHYVITKPDSRNPVEHLTP